MASFSFMYKTVRYEVWVVPTGQCPHYHPMTDFGSKHRREAALGK